MAAAKKRKKQARKKPGPEPERLKIEGDPIAAFDRMAKAPPPRPKPRRKK